MLRNLFAGSVNADTEKNIFLSFLQKLPTEPSKLAAMLSVFVIPISALGWWCYSVVLSVGAMAPLQSASGSSSGVTVPQSSVNSDTSSSAADIAPSLPSSSNNSESLNVDISNNSSQTTVTVDGQTVPVPDQGTTHKVIQNDNGQTTVDISIDSDTTGRTTSRSSTDINLRSSSSSDVEVRNKEVR